MFRPVLPIDFVSLRQCSREKISYYDRLFSSHFFQPGNRFHKNVPQLPQSGIIWSDKEVRYISPRSLFAPQSGQRLCIDSFCTILVAPTRLICIPSICYPFLARDKPVYVGFVTRPPSLPKSRCCVLSMRPRTYTPGTIRTGTISRPV